MRSGDDFHCGTERSKMAIEKSLVSFDSEKVKNYCKYLCEQQRKPDREQTILQKPRKINEGSYPNKIIIFKKASDSKQQHDTKIQESTEKARRHSILDHNLLEELYEVHIFDFKRITCSSRCSKMTVSLFKLVKELLAKLLTMGLNIWILE